MNKFRKFILTFPLETLLITLSTIAGIILNFNIYSKFLLQLLVYSSLGFVIAVPLVFAVSLLKESPVFKFSKKLLLGVQIIAIILSYLYMYWALPPIFIKPDGGNLPSYGEHSYIGYTDRPQFLYDFFMPILLGILLVILVAYLIASKREEGASRTYLNIILRFFVSIALGFIYGLAVFIGLEIAYMGIDALWGNLLQNIDISWHLVIFLIAFNFIAYKVAIDNFGTKSNKLALQIAPWVNNFVKYVLGPLFLLYSIILYPYIAKILITGKWPSNTVTPLALVYSALAIIIIAVLWFELSQKQRRFITALVIPVILMQLYGLYVRIAAYGLTVNRFELLILGIIILLLSFYLTAIKKSRLIITLYLGLVFVLFTPLAFYISKVNQLQSFYNQLNEVGIKTKNGKIVIPTHYVIVKNDKYWDLIKSAQYIWNYYGVSALNRMLTKESLDAFWAKVKYDFDVYSFLRWLHIREEYSYLNTTNNQIEYSKAYRLDDLLDGQYSGMTSYLLSFRYFKTPITIYQLESVEYEDAYIKYEQNKWILYTETNAFLIPQDEMHYLTHEDYYKDPEVIFVKSIEDADTYYLITKIILTKEKGSNKIDVEGLAGIMIYTH